MNNVLLRPATIRITIASPHLTNMGLRGLRSNYHFGIIKRANLLPKAILILMIRLRMKCSE